MCHPRNFKKGGLPPLKIIFLGLYGKTGERRHEMLCLNNNINKNVTRFVIIELYSKKVPLFTPPYPIRRKRERHEDVHMRALEYLQVNTLQIAHDS